MHPWWDATYSSPIFQFMHPARDATVERIVKLIPLDISIHASREGCNEIDIPYPNRPEDFNSCIPRGMQQ